mgnify:CR=1 FL=1
MGVLKYNYDMYNPSSLQQLSIKEQRAEYRRLYTISQKRLKALGRSEFKTSDIYIEYKDYFKSPKVLSDKDIKYALSAVARFVSLQRSSVRGRQRIRKKTIETLRERGYTFVNRGNFEAFGRFMELTRTAAENNKYDSSAQGDLFETTQRKHIDPDTLKEDFTFWLEHSAELSKLPPRKVKGKSSVELKALLGYDNEGKKVKK